MYVAMSVSADASATGWLFMRMLADAEPTSKLGCCDPTRFVDSRCPQCRLAELMGAARQEVNIAEAKWFLEYQFLLRDLVQTKLDALTCAVRVVLRPHRAC